MRRSGSNNQLVAVFVLGEKPVILSRSMILQEPKRTGEWVKMFDSTMQDGVRKDKDGKPSELFDRALTFLPESVTVFVNE
jgi:hypothetical protein